MHHCQACQSDLEILLDLGVQPLCNRLPCNSEEEEVRHALILAQCSNCGLVQLADFAPASLLKPPSLVSYNEPEGHLDRLLGEIVALPGVTNSSRVVGLTYKDRSFLQRLQERGFERVLPLDPVNDLGIKDPNAGLETVQARVTAGRLSALVEHFGRPKVMVVRHVLEHAHRLGDFLLALEHVLSPDGYLILEVPDCSNSLDHNDYSMPWEEHIAYFTPATLPFALARFGWRIERMFCYPYTLENALVAVARPAGEQQEMPCHDAAPELARGRTFAASFESTRERWHDELTAFRRREGECALLGAGHLGITFVNVLGIHEHLRFAVDDAPEKAGRYIPGSKLPIRPSSALVEEGIRLCLTSVSPESESRVIQRNDTFTRQGGHFASIFPNSRYAFVERS